VPRRVSYAQRSRGSLDRHATYIVAAYVAGTAGNRYVGCESSAWQWHRRAELPTVADRYFYAAVTHRDLSTNANRRYDRPPHRQMTGFGCVPHWSLWRRVARALG
jgi:hypothetical protein